MLFYALFRDDPNLVQVKAGDILFRQGDPAELMYVLVGGEARILVGDREVEHLAPGSVVGEMALIDPSPRSATVQAVVDCEFVAINERRFKFLVTETPGFALAIMRVLASRLRHADEML